MCIGLLWFWFFYRCWSCWMGVVWSLSCWGEVWVGFWGFLCELLKIGLGFVMVCFFLGGLRVVWLVRSGWSSWCWWLFWVYFWLFDVYWICLLCWCCMLGYWGGYNWFEMLWWSYVLIVSWWGWFLWCCGCFLGCWSFGWFFFLCLDVDRLWWCVFFVWLVGVWFRVLCWSWYWWWCRFFCWGFLSGFCWKCWVYVVCLFWFFCWWMFLKWEWGGVVLMGFCVNVVFECVSLWWVEDGVIGMFFGVMGKCVIVLVV